MTGKSVSGSGKRQGQAGRTTGSRELVVVSGYYGFDNLGDEAILEELLAELDEIVGRERIVVLSARPAETTSTFSVRSIDRWSLPQVAGLLKEARLLVSGGGGLFQDATSIRSVVYYASLVMLASALGVEVCVYAQGVGPLRNALARNLTRMAMSRAQRITVRDVESLELLKSWSLRPELSADPVWSLASRILPEELGAALTCVDRPADKETVALVGLSLRPSPHLTPDFMKDLGAALLQNLPEDCCLVPLVLQPEQDREPLMEIVQRWQSAGRKIGAPGLQDQRLLPSQWVSLIASLDLVVGMRLHALLMAVKAAVPCAGISYDPKVAYLMRNSQQPCLNLANASPMGDDSPTVDSVLKKALADLSKQSAAAAAWAEHSRQLACKNFEILDRILSSERQVR